jgi:hypothetical protein
MFRKPTVFILGAGANAEFRLPLGKGLISGVETNLRFVGETPKTQSAGEFLQLLKNRFGREEYLGYRTAAQKLVQVSSTFPSMDEALHFLSADDKCILVGKAAIVRSILDAEKNSSLKFEGKLGRPDFSGVAETWAPQFVSMAVSNLTLADISRAFEKVTIINFNYDRSLEQYLYWALQDLLVSRDNAKEIVNRMTVLRPYGSVGPLEWQADRGVPYGGPDNLDVSLFEMANGIRTYTEQLHTELRAKIDEALSNAELIVILGFGFHSQNLGLFKQMNDRAMGARRVFATARLIDKENYGVLADRLSQNLRLNIPVQLLDKAAREMLRDLRLAIMAAAS